MNLKRKKVVVIGAGPGGLSAAMLLAGRGYNVEVYEKHDSVGGRTSSFSENGYTFDVGPTFLMMNYILEEIFELSGRKLEDYLDLKCLDPMYRLVFADGKEFFPSMDRDKTREQVRKLFPGREEGYDKFFRYEEKKYKRLIPCLQVPYDSYRDLFAKHILKAVPYVDIHKSLYRHLESYFQDPQLTIAFTFQAKYLGMSPWSCPALFSIIPYIEHAMGVYHPIGGLNQITKAMTKALEEENGKVFLSTPVKKILIENGTAVGVLLENGEKVEADHFIINADFAYAMANLVDEADRPRYTNAALANKGYSCSTFMLYLGLDKKYDLPHHSIIFAEDYKRNVDEISDSLVLSADPSVYVQNASVTDPTLAPEGKSTIYVLVPVPNNKSGIDWKKEKPAFREKVLDIIETRGGFEGLRNHIEYEKIVTPQWWQDEKNIYIGATFNLAHNIRQMLMWRPHNKFEEFKNCYIVGGGTHPGSGLPTIFESGRISSGLILREDLW